MALYFSTFEAAVRLHTFPEGEAEQLVPNHRRYLADALIDLQMKIPCLKAWHVDYTPACATYWFCGATVFAAPRGEIYKVSVIGSGERCSRVTYIPVTKDDLDCVIEPQGMCATLNSPYEYYLSGGYYAPYPALPVEGFLFPNEEMNKTCRAESGYVALHQGNLYLYPSIQFDETVEIEWSGIKRAWNDGDTVNNFDREVERATELYLEAEAARKEDCDLQKYTLTLATYNAKVSDMIYQCKKERRLRKLPPCFISGSAGEFANVFTLASTSTTSTPSVTTTAAVREIYSGAAPPAAPDDPTMPAIYIPDDGSAWLRWSVALQSWG